MVPNTDSCRFAIHCTSPVVAGWAGLLLLVLTSIAPCEGIAQQYASNASLYPAQFHVDSDASWLRVLVYRGGLLGGFGHNHVVSHNGITGTVTVREDPLESEFFLEFNVAEFVIDDPELRALAGPDFPGRMSDKNIAGTRENMLGDKLLQAERFPLLEIRSEEITGSMPDVEVRSTVIVKGKEHSVVFPAAVELSGNSFLARGELEIGHRDLGLKPFKAALGTIRVREGLVLQYEISGKRVIVPE